MTRSFIFNKLTKYYFVTCAIIIFNQKIRLINPQISKTQVYKCTSNRVGGGGHFEYYIDALRDNTSTQEWYSKTYGTN